MGYDNKYGHVTTERGDIPFDEPVVVFRAKDITLPSVLAYYVMQLAKVNAMLPIINDVVELRKKIIDWQHANVVKVKVPD